jgi:hypothetical protein
MTRQAAQDTLINTMHKFLAHDYEENSEISESTASRASLCGMHADGYPRFPETTSRYTVCDNDH